MATVTEIRERLELLMREFTVTIDEEEYTLTQVGRYANDKNPLSSDQIPAFFVTRAMRGEHELTGDDRFTTRRWEIIILCAQAKDANPASKEAADDFAEAMLEPVLDYLFQHRTLDSSTENKLDGVQGMTIRDSGTRGYDYGKKSYSCVGVLVDVGNTRQIWSET